MSCACVFYDFCSILPCFFVSVFLFLFWFLSSEKLSLHLCVCPCGCSLCDAMEKFTVAHAHGYHTPQVDWIGLYQRYACVFFVHACVCMCVWAQSSLDLILYLFLSFRFVSLMSIVVLYLYSMYTQAPVPVPVSMRACKSVCMCVCCYSRLLPNVQDSDLGRFNEPKKKPNERKHTHTDTCHQHICFQSEIA